MKKLMIAAASVCVAAMSYGAAAEWTWATTGKDSKNVILDATGANLYTAAGAVTFYLFDAAVTTQDNVLKGLRDNGSITDFTAAKTTTLTAASRIDEKGGETGYFTYGEGGKDYTFWMAAVVGDKVLLSDDLVPLAGNPTSPNQAAFNKPIEWTGVDKGTADWTAGGQGWYTVVPEPTSGLLLLLGVAGLALRRRRA